MATKDITVDGNLTNMSSPVATDRLLIVDDGTTALQDVTLSVVADWSKKRFSYQLSPTVASNNLTLALLTSEGNTPTAAEPIYILIGDTIRTVSAATTCVLAAGTGWFGLSDARFAAIEQDLFAYVVWDSNSSVVAIAPARISHGRSVADFSGTAGNELYLGNHGNFTSTDPVCVIGRFAATLSAAGLWSVPTYTSTNLIHQPISYTRWLTWLPSFGGFSAVPTGTHIYQVQEHRFEMVAQETAGTSNDTSFTMTIPFVPAHYISVPVRCVDNGAAAAAFGLLDTATATATLYTTPAAGAWTNSGTKYTQFRATVTL